MTLEGIYQELSEFLLCQFEKQLRCDDIKPIIEKFIYDKDIINQVRRIGAKSGMKYFDPLVLLYYYFLDEFQIDIFKIMNYNISRLIEITDLSGLKEEINLYIANTIDSSCKFHLSIDMDCNKVNINFDNAIESIPYGFQIGQNGSNMLNIYLPDELSGDIDIGKFISAAGDWQIKNLSIYFKPIKDSDQNLISKFTMRKADKLVFLKCFKVKK